jgi:hypothetical protein
LLRFNQKPPKVSEKAIRLVLSCLPYVCIVRLAFACWMLSNNDIFNYRDDNRYLTIKYDVIINNYPILKLYLEKLIKYQYAYGGVYVPYAFIETRVFVPYIFPLFLMIVLIVIVKILIKMYLNFKFIPKYIFKYIYRFFKKQYIKYVRKNKVHNIDENGNLLAFNLMALNDPLRQEVYIYIYIYIYIFFVYSDVHICIYIYMFICIYMIK